MSVEQNNKVLELTRGIAAIPPEPPSPANRPPCSRPSRTSLTVAAERAAILDNRCARRPLSAATAAPGGWLTRKSHHVKT